MLDLFAPSCVNSSLSTFTATCGFTMNEGARMLRCYDFFKVNLCMCVFAFHVVLQQKEVTQSSSSQQLFESQQNKFWCRLSSIAFHRKCCHPVVKCGAAPSLHFRIQLLWPVFSYITELYGSSINVFLTGSGSSIEALVKVKWGRAISSHCASSSVGLCVSVTSLFTLPVYLLFKKPQ